jgi:hypothetical protein
LVYCVNKDLATLDRTARRSASIEKSRDAKSFCLMLAKQFRAEFFFQKVEFSKQDQREEWAK